METEKIKEQIQTTINETNFPWLGTLRRGKVRDIYENLNEMFIVVTDRISAFDRIISTIPFKGFVLNQLSNFWFEKTRHIVKNHVIDVPHPNVMKVKKLTPINVEMVVRSYITGVTSTSLWTAYSGGKREIAGIKLPDGLKKNQKLPQPIITPSTKADYGFHDINVSPGELIRNKVVSESIYNRMAQIALELFRYGSEVCRERGIILVDTKYEFGLDENGEIVLMDEIHTPDSSRFWDAELYEESFSNGKEPPGFDKEYIRNWLKSNGYDGKGDPPALPDEVIIEVSKRYIAAMEKITGKSFELPYKSAADSILKWAESIKSFN